MKRDWIAPVGKNGPTGHPRPLLLCCLYICGFFLQLCQQWQSAVV